MKRPDRRRIAVVSLLGVMAWMALAAFADVHLRHGVSVSWYADVAAGRVVIARTTERSIQFPNVHRPLARYVQGWPHERFPRPEELPEIDAELRAVLVVPEGAPRYLDVDASEVARVFVDGKPAGDRRIDAGRHALRVLWRGHVAPHPARGIADGRSVRLALLWGSSAATMRPVPNDALLPGDGSWPESRVALWWVAALGAVGWALLLTWAARPSPASPRQKRFFVVVMLGLVLVGGAYRLFDYDVMPEFRENADELFASWNGWSLLEDGSTRGWSNWPHVYGESVERTEVRLFGDRRSVVSPYFEHPPLLHLLAGAAAHLGGAEHWLDVKLKHVRVVPIALSLLSLLLVIAIARRLMADDLAALLGGLLYAALPIIVLQSRVVKEEALVAPLGLAMVWFFLRWRDDGRSLRHLGIAACCAGLAALAKVPAGIFVVALTTLVLMEKGSVRDVSLAAGVGVSIAASWPAFGALVDWDAFVRAQVAQAGRPSHWNLFVSFFDSPRINHNAVGRGWLLFLWLSALLGFARRGGRVSAPVVLPLVAYLAAIALSAGNWSFGWYLIPLYPYLCIGAGDFLARLLRRPSVLEGALFSVLFVFYTLGFTLDPNVAKQPDAWSDLRWMVSISALLFVGCYALYAVWRERSTLWLARGATLLGLALVIVVSGLFVARYDQYFETHHDFDRDTYFHP